MTVFWSLENFMSLYVFQINAPKKDFKKKYPYVRTGTIESMHIKDIMTKNRVFAYTSV